MADPDRVKAVQREIQDDLTKADAGKGGGADEDEIAEIDETNEPCLLPAEGKEDVMEWVCGSAEEDQMLR